MKWNRKTHRGRQSELHLGVSRYAAAHSLVPAVFDLTELDVVVPDSVSGGSRLKLNLDDPVTWVVYEPNLGVPQGGVLRRVVFKGYIVNWIMLTIIVFLVVFDDINTLQSIKIHKFSQRTEKNKNIFEMEEKLVKLEKYLKEIKIW